MKSLFAILVLVCCSNVQAVENFCDTGKPHIIDIWSEMAMETAVTTVDTLNIQSEIYARWDKELNKIYKDLMSKLNTKDKKLLRNAQRAWIKFRDAEADYYLSDAMYGNDIGSLVPIILNGIDTEFLKDRVCKLMKLRDMAYKVSS